MLCDGIFACAGIDIYEVPELWLRLQELTPKPDVSESTCSCDGSPPSAEQMSQLNADLSSMQ